MCWVNDRQKKAQDKLGPFRKALQQSYKEIVLETFCLLPSGLSMQPVPPINIREIANSDNTFFMSSSSGFSFYFYVVLIQKHGTIYIMGFVLTQHHFVFTHYLSSPYFS